MYGMGLKSASLSQADNVTVLSRAAGATPVGRRWTEAQAKAGWKCDIVARGSPPTELDRHWDDGLDASRAAPWSGGTKSGISRKPPGGSTPICGRCGMETANHLGLQLHRFLEAAR